MKDVTYDNIKSHKKPRFHPLFGKYIFGKTMGGVKLTFLSRLRVKLVASSKDIGKHHQNIPILMKELFNINKNLLPTILDDIFIKDY